MEEENKIGSGEQPEGLEGREADFYQKLRRRVREWIRKKGRTHKWADYVMLAPDLFHLMCKLSLDRDVPRVEKVKLAVAVAYFISPVDLLPEALMGPAGYLDDVALAAYVLNSIINKTDPEVVRRHWAGEGDVLEVIQRVLDVSDDMLGTGLWRRVKKLVGPRNVPKGPGI
jgi:uncharacterized membrane protein YkvA (DUF1232 family)